MYKVGLTGGIGTGKTLVSNIFSILNIPVYHADIMAKKLMNTNTDIKELIKKEFGKNVYHKNQLNNKLLASIVFSDSNKLKTLNNIVHPFVRHDFINWVNNQKNVPYVLEEAAILFETGYNQEFDKIITVYAPNSIKIERIKQRDNVDKKSIMNRMNNQLPDEDKMKMSDFIIINDNQELVIPQVLTIHKQLLNNK